MRKDKRPFVVEVKRAPKRPANTEDKSFGDAIQRAESALFGTGDENVEIFHADAAPNPVETPEAAPPRRILEALGEEPSIESEDVPMNAPKRRGRKPGSKNKPRASEAKVVRRRGRPPKASGGAVRSVPPTHDIVSAALSKIAQVSVNKAPPTGARTIVESETPAPAPVKRGRGRPRKIVPPGGFPPRVPQWVTWLQTPDEEPAAVEPSRPPAGHRETPEASRPVEIHLAHPVALVAGMRWTRRLRGGVAAAILRRARKI